MARKSKTPRSGARMSESTAATTGSANTNGAADHQDAASPPPRQPTDWSKVGPDFEFKIKYPAAPSSRKRKRGKERDTEPLSQVGPFDDELNTLYTVAPADVWEDTKRYRKFTISGETCEVGGVVLIKGIDDVPPTLPPPTTGPPPTRTKSTPMDALQNHWVAKVLEVRAGDEQHVYLRVYWLFRPEDLPGGRQWYHGGNEVVASNYMQIVDAMTVDGTVEARRWNEADDDDEGGLMAPDHLMWRQSYDCKTGQTSQLRKHCVCGLEYNPDTLLIGCSNPVCRKWLHGACIVDDAIRRAAAAANNNDEDNITVNQGGPAAAAAATPVAALAAAADGTPKSLPRTPQPRKSGRKKRSSTSASTSFSAGNNDSEIAVAVAGAPAPASASTESFSAQVVEREKGKFRIEVTDLREGASPRTWEEDVVCLLCREKID